MPRFDDIDIFDGPALDAMGVPITGSSRDMHLQMAESIIRDRYVDPLQAKAKDALKMKVSEALESVPGITGSAIAKVVAMADSSDPDDKRIFNQLVSKLNLPFDVRRTGDDYRVSKRFQDVLGDNSNVGVSAYLPDEGDNQYRIEASKRFPDFLGGEASVSANMSTEGGPEIRANFVKRFAEGGSAGDIDIFGYNLGGSVGQMMGRRPEIEVPDLSPAQMANIGAAFADPLGLIDISGEFPEFPAGDVSISSMVMEGPRSPSLAENLREGNYGSAVLQGIGVVPVVGGVMRAARGLGKAADRLERAKKAGFDTDTVYYHATDKFEGDSLDFTSLKPSERGKLGPGIYVAQDPKYTEKYIRTFKEKGKDFTEESFDEGARILPVFVRGKVGTSEDFGAAIESVKKKVKSDSSRFHPSEEFYESIKSKAQKKMAKDGFSGFKVGSELVIFNPKDVRSVNAVFEDIDSPELLKAEGGSVDANDIDIFEPVQNFVGGGGVVKKILSSKTDEIKQGIGSLPVGDEAARQGIRAFHGSPHDFPPVRELEMPDGAVVYQHMDNAVPEGARVIAEHPLGRFDMSKLGTGEGAQAYSRGLYFAEREATGQSYRDALGKKHGTRTMGQEALDSPSKWNQAIKDLEQTRGWRHATMLENWGKRGGNDKAWVDLREYHRNDPKMISAIDDVQNQTGLTPAPGRMYEVNIAATPDEFIDWDLPLDEQSESVMNALNKTDWYQYAEEGAYNAAERRGDNAYGMDLVRWLEEDGAEDAAQMLKDAGIKGVQYADAQTRFGKGPKTKNYVVYDDKLISIAKKYGISIPLASAVIAGTVTPEEAQAVGFGSVVKKSLSDKTDEIQQGIGSLPAGDEMVTGGDLQFLMNIGPEGIEKAQRLGGFPMPSLAITRQDLPFQSFGEITLVGSPTKFDPKRLKANVVFNADAYTVRAPQPFRIARKDADVEFREKYQPIAKEFDEGRVDNIVYELGKMEMKKTATAGSFSDVQRFFQSDPVADVAFLRDQGDTRSIPKRASGLIEQSELREMVQEYGDARKKWGKAQLDELFDGQEVFDASVNRDFYTGEGRVFKPYTGEEVVKFMKKSRGAAQEGGAFSVSPGKLRASLTERLTSLKKIRDQSARLVDNEKFTKFKDDSYERVTDLVESLKPFYRFDSSGLRFYDEVIELLIESEKRNLPRVMDEFGFDDVPESVVDEIQGIKSYFRTAPTEYFEAKPQRLVDLEEFEGAIVPEGTSDDLVQALKDAGIQIETYADDAQRLAARKKFGGTAFSVAGGITLVGLVPPEESYAAGPSSFIKMNKVVKDQRIKQAKDAGFDTDTVYYHGADADIEEFRMPSRETGQTKTVGTGVFMSSSPDVASSYAKSIDGAAVYPVYINKKEFLKIRPELEGNSWASISTDGLVVEFPDGSTKPATEVFDLDSASTDTDELSRLARSQGHKGLIIEGIVDTGYGGAGEYRYATKYLQEKGYDVSLPIGSTKEAYDKISAVPSEVMNAARLYAQEKLLNPADVVVSFDPKNIRSINAEFDPEKKDSPQILASAPFVGGAALAMGSVQDARAAQLAAEAAGAEVFMDAASGIVGPIAGGVAGLVEYLNPYSDREGKGERIKRYREGVGEALNYEPRSELGKDMSQSAMEGIAGLLRPVVQAVAPTARQFADYATNPDNVMDDYGLNVIPALYQGGKYIYEDIFGEPEREAVKSAIDVAL
jgi:hypothetical protein